MPTADQSGDQDVLRQFPIFSDFSDTELDEIRFLVREIKHPKGKNLFLQGDLPDGMYLVISGLISITARLPGDEVVELGRLGAGEVIGEVSLVDHSVRTATAKVVESFKGYFLSQIHFSMLQHDFRPSAFRAMNKITLILCVRIRGMIREIQEALPNGKKSGEGVIRFVPRKSKTSRPAEKERKLELRLLKQLPFFRDFTNGEIDAFLKKAKRRDLKRGEKLYREGDKADRGYLVIRGALKTSISNGNHSEQLMVLGPSQLAGDVALMDGRPYAESCEVRESSILLEISRETFEAFRASRDSLSFKFFSALNRAIVSKLRKSVRNTARLATQGRISHGSRGGYRIPGNRNKQSLYQPDPVH